MSSVLFLCPIFPKFPIFHCDFDPCVWRVISASNISYRTIHNNSFYYYHKICLDESSTMFYWETPERRTKIFRTNVVEALFQFEKYLIAKVAFVGIVEVMRGHMPHHVIRPRKALIAQRTFVFFQHGFGRVAPRFPFSFRLK